MKFTHVLTATSCAILIAANGMPIYAETPDSLPSEAAVQVTDSSTEETNSTAEQPNQNTVEKEAYPTEGNQAEKPLNDQSNRDDKADEHPVSVASNQENIPSDEAELSETVDNNIAKDTEKKDTKYSDSKMFSKKVVHQGPVVTISSNGKTSQLILDGEIGDEKSEKILGETWYYGIVADIFTFNGESETNFAVKTFQHSVKGDGQTGITDKGQGSKKAWFVAGEMDAPFMVKGIGADITVPEGSNDFFKNSTNGGKLEFHNVSKEIIINYVDDLRNDAKKESERLSYKDSVKSYDNLPQNKMTIDITSAGTNTIYLNVDAWNGLNNMLQESSGITIRKNPKQKIVLNYPKSTSVTTQKIIIEEEGKQYDTTYLANVSTQQVMIAPDIIYNMPLATKVMLNDTAGIILAPNAEVHCYGVDAGWINCAHMINDCEWHFINGELPEQKDSIETHQGKKNHDDFKDETKENISDKNKSNRTPSKDVLEDKPSKTKKHEIPKTESSIKPDTCKKIEKNPKLEMGQATGTKAESKKSGTQELDDSISPQTGVNNHLTVYEITFIGTLILFILRFVFRKHYTKL